MDTGSIYDFLKKVDPSGQTGTVAQNVLSDNLAYIHAVAYVLIGIGAFVFLVGFLGCCGAIKVPRIKIHYSQYSCTLGCQTDSWKTIFLVYAILEIIVMIFAFFTAMETSTRHCKSRRNPKEHAEKLDQDSPSIHHLIDWLIDWLVDYWFLRLIDWLIDW